MAIQLDVELGTPSYKVAYTSTSSVAALNAVSSIIKELYTGQNVEDLTLKDHELYGMIPKTTNFYGDLWPVPMMIAKNHGLSKTFTSAQSNKLGPDFKRFQLTRVRYYAFCEFYTETLRATSNDMGAFTDYVTPLVDSTYRSAADRLANQMYRNGYGILTDVTCADGTAATFTLVNPEEATFLEVGMTLELVTEATSTLAANYSATDAAVRTASTDKGVIDSIDRDAGTFTVTVSTDIDTTYSITVGATPYKIGVAYEGDVKVTSNSLVMENVAGLNSWIPSTAPTSGDDHFFVDRSVDAQRLAGIRYDGSSGLPIDEAIMKAMSAAKRYGAKPTKLFMNPANYTDLLLALGSRAMDTKAGSTGMIGYTGIKFSTAAGWIQAFCDQDCQMDVAWAIDPNKWGCKSLGEQIGRLDEDGLEWMRNSGTDSYDMRIGGYLNAFTVAPSEGMRIALPAAS